MTPLTSQERFDTKRAFENFAEQHGMRILHYHCDNGQFADNNFKSACVSANQRLTFCGVNAHFQNGIAEKAIQETVAPCAAPMASCHPLGSLAICLEIRDLPPQHPACFGQRHLQT